MAMETEYLFFASQVAITVGGASIGMSENNPKLATAMNIVSFRPFNSGGPIVGGEHVDEAIPSIDLVLSAITYQRLLLAMPGAIATAGNAIGSPVAGLDTTLAADPALGATNIKLTSVTTVNVDNFVRIGPAVPTTANSEVVRVLTVGTIGGAGTGCDIVNSIGGGLVIDHADGEVVKTVNGSYLASPAHPGDRTIFLKSVTGVIAGDIVKIGYTGNSEDRTVVSVGTAGIEGVGTGVLLDTDLQLAHAVSEWVVEVVAAGATTIAWSIGAIPESAYKDVVISGTLQGGTPAVITIKNAIGIKALETELGRKWAGIPVTLRGTYAKATPTLVPLTIALG